MGALKYKIPEILQGAAVFDPDCVLLGASVIDWCAFGFGNTVLVDPVSLGIRTESLRSAAREVAREHGWDVHTTTVPVELTRDGSRKRKPNEVRVAVVFTRTQMVDLKANQGEWLGAVERQR